MLLTDSQSHHIELDVEFQSNLGSTTMSVGPWLLAFVDGKTVAAITVATGSQAGPVTLGSLSVGVRNPGTFGGEVDEVAIWANQNHAPALTFTGNTPTLTAGTQTFTPLSAPFACNESGLRLLYHLGGDGLDSGPTIPASPAASNGGGHRRSTIAATRRLPAPAMMTKRTTACPGSASRAGRRRTIALRSHRHAQRSSVVWSAER